MPCKHAIAAIAHKNERPENYCNGWLTTGAYNATYEFYVQPTHSQEFWEATPYLKPVPPPMKRKPGRPKKCRRRDSTEATTAGGTRLRRTYVNIQCSRCGGVNHNTIGCMNYGCPVMPTGWVQPPLEENEGNQTEIDLSQNAPPEENLSQPIPQPVTTRRRASRQRKNENAGSSNEATTIRRAPRARAPRAIAPTAPTRAIAPTAPTRARAPRAPTQPMTPTAPTQVMPPRPPMPPRAPAQPMPPRQSMNASPMPAGFRPPPMPAGFRPPPIRARGTGIVFRPPRNINMSSTPTTSASPMQFQVRSSPPPGPVPAVFNGAQMTFMPTPNFPMNGQNNNN
ncbi:vegetative cell wall protein gp1-like [Lotus japonicus]|uniref:vegetative cell wall protein gp1-like n=1 Tax=Lotus japonicus TaxID=34305 RepID=UPI00258EF498|nr:vegetative cell wall protein gp1-like [Lotus japonicus]